MIWKILKNKNKKPIPKISDIILKNVASLFPQFKRHTQWQNDWVLTSFRNQYKPWPRPYNCGDWHMSIESAIMKQIQRCRMGTVGLRLTLETCLGVVREHWKAINWHITNKNFPFRLTKQLWQQKSSHDNCLLFPWCLRAQGREPANSLGANNTITSIWLSQAWWSRAVIQTLVTLRWGDWELKASVSWRVRPCLRQQKKFGLLKPKYY